MFGFLKLAPRVLGKTKKNYRREEERRREEEEEEERRREREEEKKRPHAIVSLQDGAHRRTGVHGRKVKMLARLLSRAARSSQKNVSFLGCVANNSTTTHVATANLTYVSNSPTPTSLVNGTSWSLPIQNQFQARSYSEDAFAGDNDLVPPVKMYGTSAKYASALWAAATKAKVLDNVGKELEQVRWDWSQQPLAFPSATFFIVQIY